MHFYRDKFLKGGLARFISVRRFCINIINIHYNSGKDFSGKNFWITCLVSKDG